MRISSIIEEQKKKSNKNAINNYNKELYSNLRPDVITKENLAQNTGKKRPTVKPISSGASQIEMEQQMRQNAQAAQEQAKRADEANRQMAQNLAKMTANALVQQQNYNLLGNMTDQTRQNIYNLNDLYNDQIQATRDSIDSNLLNYNQNRKYGQITDTNRKKDNLETLLNAFQSGNFSEQQLNDVLEELSRTETNTDLGSIGTSALIGGEDFVRGFGNIINTGIDWGGEAIGGILGGIADLTGDEDMAQRAQGFKDYDPNAENNIMAMWNEDAERRAYLNQLGISDEARVASDVVRSATTAGLDLLTAVVTGGGSAVITGLASGRNIAETYTDNLANGVDQPLALANSLVHGAVTALTNKLPDEALFAIASKQGVANSLVGYLSSIANQALSEGAEEGAEYTLGWLTDRIMLGSTEEYSAGQLLYSMGVGAITGGLMAGGAGLVNVDAQTQDSINQLKADVDLAAELVARGSLSPEEVGNSIAEARQTIAEYDSRSVIGDAVKFESDEPIRVTAEEVETIMAESKAVDQMREPTLFELADNAVETTEEPVYDSRPLYSRMNQDVISQDPNEVVYESGDQTVTRGDLQSFNTEETVQDVIQNTNLSAEEATPPIDNAVENMVIDNQQDSQILSISDEEVARMIQGSEHPEILQTNFDEVAEEARLRQQYMADERYRKKIANKTNNITKGYQGYSKGEYDAKYNEVAAVEAQKELLNQARTESQVSMADTVSKLIQDGKNTSSYFKTLEQNLDVWANGNSELRGELKNLLETPRDEAYNTLMTEMHEAEPIFDNYYKAGIAKGSKADEAVFFLVEGHTKETKDITVDGKTFSIYVNPYTEADVRRDFNYRARDGRNMADVIIEIANQTRAFYDSKYNKINNVRYDIYGDVEAEARLNIDKTLGDLRTAENQLRAIERSYRSNPTEALEKGLAVAQDKVKTLTKKYNNLIKDNISGDDVRRRILLHRENYIPHLQPKQTIKSSFKKLLQGGSKVPTEIIGKTETTTPRSSFNTFMLGRESTSYDTSSLRALEWYSKNSSELIAFDPYVDHLRTVTNTVRQMATGSKDNSIVGWLQEYADSLSNKTNSIDRVIFDRIFGGRTLLNALKAVNNKVKKNRLLLNTRSTIAQVLNIPNAMSVIMQNGGNATDIVKGAVKYFTSMTGSDVRNSSPFLNARFYEPNIRSAGIGDTISNFAGTMLEAGDNVATNMIWEMAYEMGVRQNVANPITYADDITRRSVGGRAKGEVPLALQSELINLVAPFQLEVNNQWQTFKNSTRKGNHFVKAFTAYSIASWLMNNMTEEIYGDRTLADPIDAILNIIGDDEDDDDETLLNRIQQSILGTVATAVPFSSILLQGLGLSDDESDELFGDYNPNRYGGGMMGITPAMDAYEGIIRGFGGDPTGFTDAASDLIANYLMPFGGGQIQRTIEGAQSMGMLPQVNPNTGGLERDNVQYSNSGNVAFAPTTNDPYSVARGLLFGPYQTNEGREYIDSNFTSGLSEKQTEKFEKFREDFNMDSSQAFDLVNSINDVEGLKDSSGKTITNSSGAQKAKIIDETIGWDEFKRKYSQEEASDLGIGKTVYEMNKNELFSFLDDIGVSAEEGSNEGGFLDNQNKPTGQFARYIDNMSGFAKDSYDVLSKFTDYENAYYTADSLDKAQGVKNDKGNTRPNSTSLARRAVLERKGLWEDYAKNLDEENSADHGIGKKVYNMSKEEFENEFREMFGYDYTETPQPAIGSKEATGAPNVSSGTNTSQTQNIAQNAYNGAYTTDDDAMADLYGQIMGLPASGIDFSKAIDPEKDSLEVAKRKIDYQISKAQMETYLDELNDFLDFMQDYTDPDTAESIIEEVKREYLDNVFSDLIRKYEEEHPYDTI